MKYSIPAAMIILTALFVLSNGCVNDPIKMIKNDSQNMEIVMNHIVNDDGYRAKMIEKLVQKGDRQDVAELLITDEDMARLLVAKIVDTEKGKQDVAKRVGNRLELIRIALDTAAQMPEYRSGIIEILLENENMAVTIENSAELKEKICAE